MSAADLAQRQLEGYNGQDVDAHCACFAPDVVVANLNGDVIRQGMQAYRDFHVKLFADFPGNRVQLLSRMAVGNRVIDHERVDRGNGDPAFEVIAIYTIEGETIARVDFIR